jgi:hypothetical protein
MTAMDFSPQVRKAGSLRRQAIQFCRFNGREEPAQDSRSTPVSGQA